MKVLSGFLLLISTGSLALTCLGGARTHEAQPQAQGIDTPKPKRTVSVDPVLSEARRLSEQGKFDEAEGACS